MWFLVQQWTPILYQHQIHLNKQQAKIDTPTIPTKCVHKITIL